MYPSINFIGKKITNIRLILSVTIYVIISSCPLTSFGQIHFSDAVGQPVLSYGAYGAWDDAVVWNPAVVKDGDTLRMWYTGHDESIWTESTTGNIGYAWSVDGYTWHKFPENPVLRAELEWEGGKLYGSAVIKDGDTLKMWYGAAWTRPPSGYDISPSKKIGYAASLDGKTWFKHPEPVLEVGTESGWDSDFIVPHTVIKEDNEYKMWFWAGKPGFPAQEESLPQIGMATSPDGIHWTKYDDPASTDAIYANSDPVLKVGSSSSWDAHRVIDPIILPTDSGYEMWYTGLRGPITSDTPQQIGYATSDDGIAWTRWPENPILDDSFIWGKCIYGGSVLKFDEAYHFWFSCFHVPPTQARPQIGYAISSTTPVNIPDSAFLQRLIIEGVDTNHDSTISYAEAEVVTSLYVEGDFDCNLMGCTSFGEISNLTGIEAFKNLSSLNIQGNKIDSINLSMNSKLQYLNCNINSLTILDLSNNSALEELHCEWNQLSSLDVSTNTALEKLNCSFNQLTSVDISDCTALTDLYCIGYQLANQLTNLDVSNNTALEILHCHWNQITSLDVSTNTLLEELSCHGNKLDSLDITNNTALKSLDCAENQLNSLDVSNNAILESLCCAANDLTYLDVSNNTALKDLQCAENQLASLDLSNNTRLERLVLYNMPTLYQVCVWTEPFPPGQVEIHISGSPNVYFTTECTIGIEERPCDHISLYPNPASDLITINTETNDYHSILITSLNGQVLFDRVVEGTTHQLDLSSFKKGVYFITNRSKDFVTTRKIIKLE